MSFDVSGTQPTSRTVTTAELQTIAALVGTGQQASSWWVSYSDYLGNGAASSDPRAITLDITPPTSSAFASVSSDTTSTNRDIAFTVQFGEPVTKPVRRTTRCRTRTS